MIHEDNNTEHVFTDIMTCVPGAEIGKDEDVATIKQKINASALTTNLWCVKHGRKCRVPFADWHTAGSPCTDFSTYGLGMRQAGRTFRFFWAWVKLIKKVGAPQADIIVYER